MVTSLACGWCRLRVSLEHPAGAKAHASRSAAASRGSPDILSERSNRIDVHGYGVGRAVEGCLQRRWHGTVLRHPRFSASAISSRFDRQQLLREARYSDRKLREIDDVASGQTIAGDGALLHEIIELHH